MLSQFRNKFALLVSMAFLLGMSLEALSLRRPEDAEPYHTRVREAAAQLPFRIGDWIASPKENTEIPKEAVALLRPNVIFCRRYTNIVTGRAVTFLLVQCGDARDLVGHYPPVCYGNQGWTLRQKIERDWKLDDDFWINGMEYEFDRMSFMPTEGIGEYPTTIRIANFMILPDGRIMRDMESVRQAAADLRKRFYGAAQVQLVFDAGTSEDQRALIVRELVGGNRKLLDAIRSGGRS